MNFALDNYFFYNITHVSALTHSYHTLPVFICDIAIPKPRMARYPIAMTRILLAVIENYDINIDALILLALIVII